MTSQYQKLPNTADLTTLQTIAEQHRHTHIIDLPYRLTSTWQDHNCDLGLWGNTETPVAWGVFLPPWWNYDYTLPPEHNGSALEEIILNHAIEEMHAYAQRTGDQFWGSVELFADRPRAADTITILKNLGFQQFDWSTVRFENDLSSELPQLELPAGFQIRPIQPTELNRFVELQQAAFNSKNMTEAWRKRIVAHQAYIPSLDLVVTNPDDLPVGFCINWLLGSTGQLEPLGVHPDFQGIGLGKALEIASLHALKQRGATTALVDHTSFNERAIQLSQQNGFRQTHNALRFYVEVG